MSVSSNITIIYILSILILSILFYIINNFSRISDVIIFIFFIISMLVNYYLSYNETIFSYKDELDRYSYVETNARVLLPYISGFAILLIFSNKTHMTSKFIKILVTAVISLLLIVTLYWMPRKNGEYIRYLRDIKNNILMFSIIMLILLMVEFYINNVYENNI